MFCDNDTVESLKLKQKSITKQKLSKEKEVLLLRNKERSLTDELNTTKAEIEYLTEHLQVLKTQITQSKHQISMIDICTTSEDMKIETHVATLNKHLEGFQQVFDRDRRYIELRMTEKRNKIAEQQELLRQQEKQIAEENERDEREAVAIEDECGSIERECAVLKKRNNAIMLKLRKRLLEAENTRREAMKRNTLEIKSNNETKL